MAEPRIPFYRPLNRGQSYSAWGLAASESKFVSEQARLRLFGKIIPTMFNPSYEIVSADTVRPRVSIKWK